MDFQNVSILQINCNKVIRREGTIQKASYHTRENMYDGKKGKKEDKKKVHLVDF